MTDRLSTIRRYGAELVIVFVGVLAAFWVEDWRDQQAREERTQQVVETLRQDLADHVDVGNMIVTGIDEHLATWQAAFDRGEKPAPYILRINRSETAPITAWEAVSNSAVIELLDPTLIFDLGFYYSETAGVGRKFVRYSEFTDAEVMPGLKRGNEWFYDQETGALKPQFAAHMDRLRDYRTDTSELVEWARCLRDRLAPDAGERAACRPADGWLP